jgi:hypothetical protein
MLLRATDYEKANGRRRFKKVGQRGIGFQPMGRDADATQLLGLRLAMCWVLRVETMKVDAYTSRISNFDFPLPRRSLAEAGFSI